MLNLYADFHFWVLNGHTARDGKIFLRGFYLGMILAAIPAMIFIAGK